MTLKKLIATGAVLVAGAVGAGVASADSGGPPVYPTSHFFGKSEVGMVATNLDPGAGYGTYAVGYTFVSDDGTRSTRGSWTGYTDTTGLFEGDTSTYAVTRGLPGTLTMWVYEGGLAGYNTPIVGANGPEQTTIHVP